MKKLTMEGIFECGILDLDRGKLRAFTAAIHSGGMGLGLAVANEPGYRPVPLCWCRGDDYAELARHADDLNREYFTLEPDAAARVVASSMAAGRVRDAMAGVDLSMVGDR